MAPPTQGDATLALGYRFLNQKMYDRATEILVCNIRLFPQSANAQDSLVEAYATKGDRENAIKYKLAVEKNPGATDTEKRILQNSKDKLKELGVETK